MPAPLLLALSLLLVTFIVLRISRRSSRMRVRIWTWISIIAFYTMSLCMSPELRDGFVMVWAGIVLVLMGIAFLAILPIIIFGVVVGLAAPTVKGGEPPKFF